MSSVEQLAATVRDGIRASDRESRAALELLAARATQAEADRDDYRFWNERVRVCEHHTQDVAAPVGDCLICNAEEFRTEAARLREQLDAALRDYVARDRYDAMQFVYMAEVEKREAAEARCARLQDANDRLLSEKARLQQALRLMVEHTPADTLTFEQVREIAREALAGPDTPADTRRGDLIERVNRAAAAFDREVPADSPVSRPGTKE